MLTPETFKMSTDMGLLMISLGISVGVALTATIFWADTYWKLFFRLIRATSLAGVVIFIPIWYPHAAVLVHTMIAGL